MHLPLALALLASPLGPAEQEKLFAQLDRCIAAAHAIVEEAPRYDPACSSAVRSLVDGGVEDRRLWRVYDALPAYASLRVGIVHALLERRVERALAALPEANPVPRAVTSDDSLEAALVEASAVHKVVNKGVADRLAAARGELSERSSMLDREAFEATLAAYVRGQLSLEAAEAEVARYVAGGSHLTFRYASVSPKMSVVLLKALEDRRWSVAAGCLNRVSLRTELGANRAADDPKQRLLTLASLDWEQHEVGAALAGDENALLRLGEYGSAWAARLLTAATESGSLEVSGSPLSSDVLPTLAAFVTPGKGCDPTRLGVSVHIVFRVSPALASETTQQQILQLLAKHAATGEDADTLSFLLLRLCRSESRDAFRGMLESPFARVRNRGFDGLRGLGDNPVPPVEPRPIQFQIVVDGRPFASRSVWWRVKGPRGATSSAPTTDDRGGFTIDRDPFADPKARVERIVVSAGLHNLADPWFVVDIPAPENLDRLIGVAVDTQKLTVRLAEESDPLDAAGVDVRLSPIPDDNPERLPSQRLSRQKPIVFERLQQGRRYRIAVYGPGGRRWTSDEVLLGSAPAVIVVPPR